MTERNPMQYLDSSDDASRFGEAVIGYILHDEAQGLNGDIEGLRIFGVIEALRKNDEILQSEDYLTEVQKDRLAEIEHMVGLAVSRGLHYYPFGHDQAMSKTSSNKQSTRSQNHLNSTRKRNSRRRKAKARRSKQS